MKTSQSITKIANALLKAQMEMDAVTKDSQNPYFNSNYADINKFLEVIKPALNKNGVLLLQPTGLDNSVETVLIHAESGEFISSDALKLVLSKQDMQNVGACITYARRFSLQSMLGMEAQDDDGETAVGRGSQSKLTSLKLTIPETKKVESPAPVKKVEEPKPTSPVVEQPVQEKPKPSFKKPSQVKGSNW